MRWVKNNAYEIGRFISIGITQPVPDAQGNRNQRLYDQPEASGPAESFDYAFDY